MGSNLVDKLNPEKLKTGGEYRIIDPRLTYRGKCYSEWISDWFNWFISADADIRNSGPVVFLRSMGLPKEGDMLDSSIGRSQVDNSTTPNQDPNYPKKYFSGANFRFGGDRLQITEDQAVLVPIIMAYEFGGSYKDWGYLQDFTGLTIDNGDDPPSEHQLTIDNEDIKFPNVIEMQDFRIVTPIFTAIIPEVEPGRSVKDLLEIPAISGNYPVMVEGYFVMLKFTPRTNSYWIHSWASAPREATGPYFSELIYEIQVFEKRKTRGVITKERPARNEALLLRILEEEQKKPKVGRVIVSTASRIESYLKPGVTRA
jgi:hypothetical protein